MVENAIVVAGGLGSRMLPVSSVIPKEILPLVDIPALYHLVWEVLRAGITKVHLVLSPRKLGMEETLYIKETILEHFSNLRPDLPKLTLQPLPVNVELSVHIQEEARGMADAVFQASDTFSGPFIVLLGDNLLMDQHVDLKSISLDNASSASLQLVERFNQVKTPIVGLKSMPESELNKYGVVALNGQLITDIVEKPNSSLAPSDKVLCGRYLFDETFNLLMKKYLYSEFGELQSIAIQKHWMKEERLNGLILDGFEWYDSGDPLVWLRAQIDHALRRNEYSEELNEWLKKRLS